MVSGCAAQPAPPPPGPESSVRTSEDTTTSATREPSSVQRLSPIPGHQRVLRITRIPQLGTEASKAPKIDGKLDDEAWLMAEASGEFWNSLQDRSPSDQTEVMSIGDGEYLYFGFRMYESEPEEIQATRTVRDAGLGYDDSITVELDTFFNRRDISEFSVNAAGTQTDEIAGGRSSKIEWKGDWLGAAVRTDYGWSAEFAIPFEILNYDEDTTRFGLNFQRYQSRTREYTHWADVTPQKREEEMGQLVGLELPEQTGKSAWMFMPFVLAGRNIEDEDGRLEDSLITGGIDMRYEPRPDMTGVISINPDFSQIERAVTDISFSYSEKSVAENRPFFTEGGEYFSPDDDDDQYFYSNRIPDFDVGGKSFGRIGRARLGSFITSAPDGRTDFVGRTLYELNETNSAIGTIVSSQRSGLENLLTLAQFRGRLRSGLTYSVDAASTNTSKVSDRELPIGNGAHYDASIGWKGDYLYSTVRSDSYETSYFPANARLDDDLVGTRGAKLTTGYYRELSQDRLRLVQGYFGAEYRDTESGERQREKVYAGGSIEFMNDIEVSTFVEDGPYRPLGDERGVFQSEVYDDRYASVSIAFNTRSNVYSYGVSYDRGDFRDERYRYGSAYIWWRPMNKLHLQLSAERSRYLGTDDQVVLTSSWDITPENSLSGRYLSSEGEDYFRVAYAHRPRDGLDIYAVFDKDHPTEPGAFSVKVVQAF
jgi:hypothetical protein